MKVVSLAISLLAATLATTSTILLITNRAERLRSEAQMLQMKANEEGLTAALAAAKTQTTELGQRYSAMGQELEGAKHNLETSERRIGELESQLIQSRNQLTLRDENEMLLNREIAAHKKDIGALQARIPEIDTLRHKVSQLEQSLALASNKNGPDGRALNVDASQEPRSILAVGPSNAFVIANIGDKSGARKGARLLIRRGTDFIGSALISEVFEDLCIAQVDPHALRETLHSGDGIVLSQ